MRLIKDVKVKSPLVLLSVKIILILLLTLNSLLADDFSYGGSGATIYPVYNNEIQMLNEQIDIYCSNNCYYYHCIFNFTNYGRATNISIAFPDYVISFNDGESFNSAIHGFKVYEKNKEIPVQIKKIDQEHIRAQQSLYQELDSTNAFCWTIKFKQNEKKTIKNTYSMRISFNSIGESYLEYILFTGSFWKDKINYIEINIYFQKPVFLWQGWGFGVFENEWKSYFENLYDRGDYLERDKKVNQILKTWDSRNQVLYSGDFLCYKFYNIEPAFNLKFAYMDFNTLFLKEDWSIISNTNDVQKKYFQLLINSIYAKYGYIFKDKQLTEYFSHFTWYKPDKKFSESKIKKSDRKILNILQKYLKRP